MNSRLCSTTGRCCSCQKAGWWGRVLFASLVSIYLNYIPIHLATAAHLESWSATGGIRSAHEHPHGEQQGHNHHQQSENDEGGHVPHAAVDHTLIITAQSSAPGVLPIPAVGVIQGAWIDLEMRGPPGFPDVARIKPPGESPPDPLRSRAPPAIHVFF